MIYIMDSSTSQLILTFLVGGSEHAHQKLKRSWVCMWGRWPASLRVGILDVVLECVTDFVGLWRPSIPNGPSPRSIQRCFLPRAAPPSGHDGMGDTFAPGMNSIYSTNGAHAQGFRKSVKKVSACFRG